MLADSDGVSFGPGSTTKSGPGRFRAIRRLDRGRPRRDARMLFEGRSILPGYVRGSEQFHELSSTRERCSDDSLKIFWY